MKTYILSLLFLLGFICMSQAQNGVATNLNAAQFSQKMQQTPNKIILDVRTPPEVAGGTLPGAVVMDYNAPDFGQRLARLDRTKPVFVYCAVGGRSGRAMQQMQQAGFKTIYNLTGGMQAWQQAGYGIVKGKL